MLPYLAQIQTSQANRLIDTIARTPLSRIILLVAVLTVLRLAIAPYLNAVPAHRRSGAYGFYRFMNETFDAIVYAGVFVFLIIRPFFIQMFQIPSGSMLETLQIGDFIVANKAIYRYSEPKVGDIVVFRPPKGAIQELAFIDSDGQVNQDFIKRCVGVPGDVVEIKGGKLWRNGKAIDEPYLKEQDIQHYYKLVFYRGPYAPFNEKYIPVDAAGPFSDPEQRVNAILPGGPPIGEDYAVGIESRDVLRSQDKPDGVVQITSKPYYDLLPEEKQLNDDLCKLPPAPIPKGFYLMMGDNRNGSFDGRFWGLISRSQIIGRSEAVMWPPKRWRRTR